MTALGEALTARLIRRMMAAMETDSGSISASAARRAIHVLPDALVNKIAAGEVVERPASVVKELLENSVDAGARRISITIENGGKTLIRITDDGCGMSPEEAPLAFARHATSKIASVEDLFAINTMGFRGEALASVAGVSHARLITRPADAPQAVQITAQESLLSPAVPCAAPPGTTVEVRDLFYCVPARRKFLRGDSTEFGHIQEMVLRIALAHPHIAISLTHNGRCTLDLPTASDHLWRIVQALGDEFKDRLFPVNLEEPVIQVHGYVGLPEIARATSRYQYLFLNGRYIRDRSILHALKEAYRGLIEPQAQPVAVLFLTMSPAAFDVNVHPQKIEVRFRESNLAHRAVLSAVRQELLSRDLTAQARLGVTNTGTGAAMAGRDVCTEHFAQTRQIISDFFRRPQPDQPRQSGFGFEKSLDSVESVSGEPGSPAAALSTLPADDDRITPQYDAGVPASLPAVAGDPGAPVPPATAPPVTVARETPVAPPAGIPRFMQFHNAYLVVEEPDGLLFIDQHALHERVIYEQLLARGRDGPLPAQRLLLPVIVPVNPRQTALLERLRNSLARVGVEISEFDADSVAIQSLPSLLARLNPLEYLRDLLDKLLETSGRISDEELLHEVLDMAACKAAIKAGDPLSPAEIEALLACRHVVERASNCPHGRPTTLRLSRRDLEKQFKRR